MFCFLRLSSRIKKGSGLVIKSPWVWRTSPSGPVLMVENLQVVREEGGRVFCRGLCPGSGDKRLPVLVFLATEYAAPAIVIQFAHEYGLKDELDGAWAARPLELLREHGRDMLVLEDPGGELLDRLLGAPLEVGTFLRLSIGISTALRKLHQQGLVHKDIKPANILVNCTGEQVWLTGFGIASRLPRERQWPDPAETIAGTLAYMSPEQTGRMNRSIDSRSDLYSLGITFYEMLTGTLPFSAADPIEWVHCHIARQAEPPDQRAKEIPKVVSAIVMKLLAKTAEERYQTAAGLEADLRRCLADFESHGHIDGFLLGAHDALDRLLIPEKLYGREREINSLVAAFNRVVAQGGAELVLISGYSGIGKSSVVNELHKVLVPPRGLFASGKFDQYKRDIPYSTLAQALQALIRALLIKKESELGVWRDAISTALGPNGRLMVDLVPELTIIIGDQPPLADLPPEDAQRRFQQVFRRFLGVFARPEHPLALFLDDLQWLDAATLDLLEDLLAQQDVQHLFLIGAYRDNEVNPSHPLLRKLATIRKGGAVVHEITLAPLAREDLGQLIADALRCEAERATELAQLVHEKTAGNPFFAIQFISELSEEGLLTFDCASSRWSWDPDRVHTKGYTDNVVDLMVGKLNRLPIQTRTALQQLACLGNGAAIPTFSLVHGTSENKIHSDLWEAVRLGLIERLEGSYKFVHDRVQEAAYSVIPEDMRTHAHLRIGRLLAAHIPSEKLEESIFDVVNQLNRGTALITSQDERDRVARLNVIAGRRARASSAYASALTYFLAGAVLLGDDCWERQHDLAISLELHRAECEFLTGAVESAGERLAMLALRAANAVEAAAVTGLRVDVYMSLDQTNRAIEIGLDYLRGVGVEWSPHPGEEEARRAYDATWVQLGERPIEEMVDLPLMSDPASLATLEVLNKVAPAAMYTDVNLFALVCCKGVSLSLERGNSDASCPLYVRLGMVAGACFGDYKAGHRFGQVGYELVEQRGLRRFLARTYVGFGNAVTPWTKHVRAGRDLIRRAFEAANNLGDRTYGAYSSFSLITNLLVAGDSLVDVQREAEHRLAFVQKARFGLAVDIIATQIGLVRTLRGLTPKFGSFDDEQFDELLIERRFVDNPNLARAEGWYWVLKLQARYLAGDYASAIEVSQRAQRLLWTTVSQFETAEYYFYGALSRAASCDDAAADQRQVHMDALAVLHRQLQIWAENCPENFENRAALVSAEVARIEDRVPDAMRCYEQAIRSARANGFVQNEALANELAGRFYAARGFEQIAQLYLRAARRCYLSWGADGKVRQLDEIYPYLRMEEPALRLTSTIGAPVEQLDLATVIKVSQAVSGEMILEKLIETIMRTAIEQAGAERGLLIFPKGVELRIEAEAITEGDTVVMHLRDEAVADTMLPESVLHYVVRTRKSMILDDAATPSVFAADPYIRQRQARSVLCLPLLNQTKLIGVLYLENNLAPRVFAATRTAVLKLLASQAAIALENSRLYRDLAEREAKIRRLVDANIIGIFIWDFDGHILEANEAFLNIVGYDREDLAAGRLRWTDLTPPESRDLDAQLIEENKMSGRLPPFEKEYLRKDGSRAPVLIGLATLEQSKDQGVAFVVDLTQHKQAEAALRESEEQWKAVFENNPVMYFMVDATGTILSVNPFGAEQLGYTTSELIGRPMHHVFHEADREAVRSNAGICLKLPGKALSWELRKVRKNGEVIWVRETARATLIKNRQVLLIVCEDITEGKRAAEALREVQTELAHANRIAAMGQLTASIAHEVSQPIAAARNNASAALRFLDSRPSDLDEVREALRCLVCDADRAADVLSGIRAFVKKALPRRESFDISEAIRDVIVITRGEAIKNDIAVEAQLAEGLPRIQGDRVQLQQVILNLIINAIQAMSDLAEGKRELRISAELIESEGVRVAVRDTGPGLGAEDLQRLFVPFNTTKPNGIGIGLSICQSIIEDHGGRIWATRHEPHGALFQFTVPAT
jgi:PAS domain S-box-containing protein